MIETIIIFELLFGAFGKRQVSRPVVAGQTKLQEEAQKRLDTAPPCSCTRYHGTHGAAILLGDFISAAAEMARPSFFEFCERWEGNYKSCAPRLRAPRLAS